MSPTLTLAANASKRKFDLLFSLFLSPNTTSEQKYWSLSFHDRLPHVLDGFCHPQKLTCPDRSTLSKKSKSAWTRSRFFWYSFRDWPVITSSPRLFQSPDFKSTSVLTHEAPVANVGFLKSSGQLVCSHWAMMWLHFGEQWREIFAENLEMMCEEHVRAPLLVCKKMLRRKLILLIHWNQAGEMRLALRGIIEDIRAQSRVEFFNGNSSGCGLCPPLLIEFRVQSAGHDCLQPIDVWFRLLWPNNTRF